MYESKKNADDDINSFLFKESRHEIPQGTPKDSLFDKRGYHDNTE